MVLGKTSFLTLTTVIAILAAASHYVPTMRSADWLMARFDMADANHDGKLTLAEVQKSIPRLAKRFDQVDKAHLGTVTFHQIAAFIDA